MIKNKASVRKLQTTIDVSLPGSGSHSSQAVSLPLSPSPSPFLPLPLSLSLPLDSVLNKFMQIDSCQWRVSPSASATRRTCIILAMPRFRHALETDAASGSNTLHSDPKQTLRLVWKILYTSHEFTTYPKKSLSNLHEHLRIEFQINSWNSVSIKYEDRIWIVGK